MRRSVLFYLLPALALVSCSEDLTNDQEEQLITEELPANVEVAYPGERGQVSEYYFAGQQIPVEEINGDYIYEGDIMLPPDGLSTDPVKLIYEKGETPSEKSVGRTSGRWPNNTVYYAIDGNLASKDRVFNAIKHWEANTALKFVQRTSQSNYINFTTGSGCSSYIGMIGGKQNIILASGCSTGNTIHEIGHAVGLWHEQSRADRDNHIKINFDNVQAGMEHNFRTYKQSGYDGKEYTSNLDFGSIMMYGPFSFSKNGNPTIVKANGSTYTVQRTSLSTGDKQGINSMYPSNTTTPTSPGYINGEYYTLYGLTVLRFYDKWYYSGRYGMKQVVLKGTVWYYA